MQAPSIARLPLRSSSALRGVYAAGALLLLLPIWMVSRVPTVDGPSHLYNAWVMRHLDDSAYPLFASHFYVDLEPVPNWLVQALLCGLLALLEPAVAEKVLLSGYVLLFAAAAWWFAGVERRERRVNAFLALPFVYTLFFHFGFYNFLVSLPLFLLAAGWWWRGRSAFTWRWALGLHALLLLCWFAHVVSFALAGLTIAVLWATSFERERWRRWLLHPLLLLPQLVLPLWFLSAHGGAPSPSSWTFLQSWRHLTGQHALFVFHRGHGPGKTLTWLFVLLAVATLIGSWAQRRSRNANQNDGYDATSTRSPAGHAFLFAALAATLIYFTAPGGMGAGGILEARLALYPFLLLLPWLSLPRFRASKEWLPATLLAALLAIVVVWESASLVRWHRHEARLVDELLAGHEGIPRDSRGLDIVCGRYDRLETQVLGHAVGHAAMAKGVVDWDDYQAATDLFPVRFRPEVRRAVEVEKPPEQLPLEPQVELLDWIYTWSMPPRSPLRPRLSAHYDRASVVGRGELWLRRR